MNVSVSTSKASHPHQSHRRTTDHRHNSPPKYIIKENWMLCRRFVLVSTFLERWWVCQQSTADRTHACPHCRYWIAGGYELKKKRRREVCRWISPPYRAGTTCSRCSVAFASLLLLTAFTLCLNFQGNWFTNFFSVCSNCPLCVCSVRHVACQVCLLSAFSLSSYFFYSSSHAVVGKVCSVKPASVLDTQPREDSRHTHSASLSCLVEEDFKEDVWDPHVSWTLFKNRKVSNYFRKIL